MRLDRRLRQMLFYNWIITAIFEGYIIVSISCIIQAPLLSFDGSFGIKVHSIVCLVFMASFQTMPYWFLIRLSRFVERLEEDDIKERYGAIYDGLELSRGSKVLLWPCFFLIRRLMLALTLIYVSQLPCQFILVFAQSILAFALLKAVQPL